MTNPADSDTLIPYLPFFVYGTLLPGQPNHSLWSPAIHSLSPATLRGFVLLDLGPYPMMVCGLGEVVGMVADVDAEQFAAVVTVLDFLEGFNPGAPEAGEYRRERQIVHLAGGEQRVAWTYVGYPPAAAYPLVPFGNWKRHTRGLGRALDAWWEGVSTVGGRD